MSACATSTTADRSLEGARRHEGHGVPLRQRGPSDLEPRTRSAATLWRQVHGAGHHLFLVYPNPIEPVAAIRRHLKDYSYLMRALRDPRHDP
jgi:hypothetical protein